MRLFRPRNGSLLVDLGLLAVACVLSLGELRPAGAQERSAANGAERRLADYEKELHSLNRDRRRLARAFNTLLAENQQLQTQMLAQAAQAEATMAMAARLPSVSRVRSSERDDRGKRTTTERIVDNSGTKSRLASNAMRLMTNLSVLQGSQTVRNNQVLAKLAVESEKNSRDALQLADLFGRRGVAEAQRASEIMGDALAADPYHSPARVIYAAALLRLGRLEEAEEQFTALAAIPSPLAAVGLAALGYLRQVALPAASDETRREGAADMQRALAAKSRLAEPLLFRALVSWEAERWTLAEADFKAALRLAPDHIDALRLSAWFRAARPGNAQDLDEAEAAAQRACELTLSAAPGCLESLALVQARRREWAAAADSARRAAELASDAEQERLRALAEQYRAERDVPPSAPRWAIEVPAPRLDRFEQLVAETMRKWREPGTDPTPLEWLARGRALATTRRWSAALSCFEQATPLPPLLAQAYAFEYGCLAWLAGEKREYAEFCQIMLSRGTANSMGLLLASVTPDSGVPPLNVVTAVRNNNVKGITAPLAAYRAGQMGEAREQTLALMKSTEPMQDDLAKMHTLGLANMLVALLDAKVGEFHSARTHAKDAHGYLQAEAFRVEVDMRPGNHSHWLVLQILDRELETLMKDAKAP